MTLESTPEELGIDSLAIVESIFAIEETFDIQVPFNANEQGNDEFDISTIGAIVEAVEEPRRSERAIDPGMRRVVITGQGTINPLGKSVPETVEGFANGRCGIGELDIRYVERLMVKVGGQVRDFEPEEHFDRQELALYDRFTQFAIIAADEAMRGAGLSKEDCTGAGAGIVLGTAGGGLNTWDDSYRKVYEEGSRRVHPFVVPKLMNNAAASSISMKYGLVGPSFSVSTACSSSNHAIGLAFQMVRTGMADMMLTGGSESTLCFGGVKAWEGLRVMSSTACRPFCATRSGMVQGEGAAVFVLEEFEGCQASAVPTSLRKSAGSP